MGNIPVLLQVSGNRMSSRELTPSWRSSCCLVRCVGTGNITHPANGSSRPILEGNQQRKADLLLDSGAEVSILDAAFARKVGCYVDESRQQECVGIGEGVYATKGRIKIKVTLVPAGIHLDLADWTLCLPDEIHIQLLGQRPLYGEHVSAVSLSNSRLSKLARSSRSRCDLNRRRSCGSRAENTESLRWSKDLDGDDTCKRKISDRTRCQPAHTLVGMWLSGDRVPRSQAFVTVGSRRYAEWQNLVLQATTDAVSEEEAPIVESAGPMVNHPQYDPPKSILKRPAAVSNQIAKVSDQKEDESTAEEVSEGYDTEGPIKTKPIESASELPTARQPLEDDQVCISEKGELFAKDVDSQKEVLPEVTTTTEDVKLEDIRIENDENALLPAARGVVCDIDTGDAKPVAQRVRRVIPQSRDKLSDLIKGLLSAKIIRVSSSSWASPIVVIIKKNGVDIRLCIDYRVVNSLARLMVYPMPLINDLHEDLDKVLWYCSLDMSSGFWVVEMTERDRMIYQRLLDNALYGYLRIPEGSDQFGAVDVFQAGEPDLDSGSPVLGRRSYIDNILVTAESWESLCDKVERLLNACDRWNLSISVVKSSWGCRKGLPRTPRVSRRPRSSPEELGNADDPPVPRNYELREVDFHEMSRDPGQKTGDGIQVVEDGLADEKDKWDRAQTAFEMLKNKIATATVLRHFDSDRVPVVVVYASDWAISAALVQEHDGMYMPVTFTSRTLKPNELNYGMVEKEILALLRILDVCYSTLVTRPIKVLIRHSTLAWLMRSTGLQGRLGNWAALLSPWTLEIVMCTRGEDEILGTVAASITPRENVDSILSSIAPRKQPRQQTPAVIPTVEPDEELLVVSWKDQHESNEAAERVALSSGSYLSGLLSPPNRSTCPT
ncbi:hypothetical protein F444_11880 [Phytophthora nicotianae P1976]|uniref:Reverse transcriptase/retrotransposon-derived protein RNase H-like domain-containing protein n=1 Tax=Phytophthora nicotianae P1976 TaxID=1317066 RepID=A0A080ZYX6_PHYNI|nr:hypothetical protein F444_11880 [Phytophthora nicotianae P1976]